MYFTFQHMWLVNYLYLDKYRENFHVKTIFKIFISVILLSYIFYTIDFAPLQNIHLDIIFYMTVSVFITFSSLFIMSFRWSQVIAHFSGRIFRLVDLYAFYLIGSFFSIFLPGSIGGDITRINNSHKKYFKN